MSGDIFSKIRSLISYSLVLALLPLPLKALPPEDWVRDITYFEVYLPRRHKNLFSRLPEQKFIAGCDSLRKNVPQLTDRQVEIELHRILAEAGDSHTHIDLSPKLVLPIELREFVEGLAISGASFAYREYLGSLITRIEGHQVDDVVSVLRGIIAYENESKLKNTYPRFIVLPEYLHALGLSDSPDAITFTVLTADGVEETLRIRAISQTSEIQLFDNTAMPAARNHELPMSMRNMSEPYWFAYDEYTGSVYFAYNTCADVQGKSFTSLETELLQILDQQPVSVLFIDLRRNGGGNSNILRGFIEKLPALQAEKSFELYTAIGRNTFSSALLNAVELKEIAGAALVGEPTGGKPGHFGEVRGFRLPRSGLNVLYSTKYFTSSIDTDSLYPDISAPLTLAAYIALQDPVPAVLGFSMENPVEFLVGD